MACRSWRSRCPPQTRYVCLTSRVLRLVRWATWSTGNGDIANMLGGQSAEQQKSPPRSNTILIKRVGLFYLWFVPFADGWSLLLTVNNSVWSFLFLRLRFALVIFAYSGKSVWSFLLTVPPVRKLGLVFSAYGSPCPEIGFGLFCLRFHRRK